MPIDDYVGPKNLRGSWLYGGNAEGRSFGPGSPSAMKVRDKFGKGYTTAHSGSCAVTLRDPVADALDAVGLTRAERQVMELQAAKVAQPDIATRLQISLHAVESRLARAWAKVRHYRTTVESMGK